MVWPIIGALTAIAVTTAMDANGLSAFSALPLFPLMGLYWWRQRFSRADMGFTWGRGEQYRLALYYPLIVLGAVTLIAAIGGSVDLSETEWAKVFLNLILVSVTTVLVAILTEEGFFRGWLWASLSRAGLKPGRTLLWSSVAFALWHVSVVSFDTGFELPPAQATVYILNVAVIGWIWGVLRRLSGSVIVASVSHGLWNGITYTFFGFGTKAGALGIENTSVLGPETGIVGLVLNLGFAFTLWGRQRGRLEPAD